MFVLADLGQPEFDRLSLGAGDALDEAQQRLGGGRVGEIIFPVGGGHFQLATFCDHLTSPGFQTVFLTSSNSFGLFGDPAAA